MMTEFTPFSALFGGILIGLSAFILLFFNGKVAGISGIISNATFPSGQEKLWRWIFLMGILLGAYFMTNFDIALATDFDPDWILVLSAGLLTGSGTKLANGCTSGHAICGLGRLSFRSLVATCIFMFTAIITVLITRHIIGN